jgi:signal transduction histidine kinase/integral membrane sensor domain MASE1
MSVLRHEQGRFRIAMLASGLAVCAGYYAGAQLGVQLRLPTATPSVLWPPNAILASALILTAPRLWPLVLLAAFPAHLAVQIPTGWPLGLILALFVTNCLEATLAAGIVWLLSDAPSRFDTFGRFAVFIVAAIVAPLVSSFADAGVVTLLRGEPYWQVWVSRLFSNILAEVTIIPAVVGVATGLPKWLRHPSSNRPIEAAVLGMGLVATALFALNSGPSWIALQTMSRQTPLAMQLPFLLWATFRFGPTGTAVALLTTTTLSAWVFVHGWGPFAPTSPSTTVMALTLSLIVVAVTLMCLTTLLEERRQSQRALALRLRFEELLARLSSAFVHLPSDQMDRAFGEELGRIGAFLRVDWLGLFIAADGGRDATLAHGWMADAFRSSGRSAEPADFPWTLGRLVASESVVVSSVDRLPPEAAVDRAALQRLGLKSGFAVPLTERGRVIGALVSGGAGDVEWPGDLSINLRLVAEVLANVLARKRTEDALRRSELMKSAILESLTSGVVVVGPAGEILAHNDSWRRLAHQSGCGDLAMEGNLLEGCAAAARGGSRPAAAIADGVSRVLAGSQPQFVFEHRLDGDAQPRWWSLLAVRLNSPKAGAVITLTDITDLRRAEHEAQRSHLQLAHVSRVSTIGEMTASLAHQLNQPLAAIMTNAQAARRILDSPVPDFAEVRAILLDIVNDDRRASDVIQRLRDMLRRGQIEMTTINLTAVIRDVADLVSSEAIIRNVALSLQFDREPVFVRGDRVQLQQVVLNLVQNAMEAMTDLDDRRGTVTVRCQVKDGQIGVSVRDSGPGLKAGAEDMIFEPFYTTKPGGMGMGLSIVRSIVEAHGGSIRAANDDVGGAILEFVLPAGTDRAA